MRREDAYHLTLDAIAKMQWNVAAMLEAKAFEAEKVRNWMLAHFTHESQAAHSDRLSTSLEFHEQHVEVIEGLTKLCNGLSRNMKIILHPEEEVSGSGGGGLGSMGSLFDSFDSGDKKE